MLQMQEKNMGHICPIGRSGVKKGALDSDFMFVNIEPYKSKKCVPY